MVIDLKNIATFVNRTSAEVAPVAQAFGKITGNSEISKALGDVQSFAGAFNDVATVVQRQLTPTKGAPTLLSDALLIGSKLGLDPKINRVASDLQRGDLGSAAFDALGLSSKAKKDAEKLFANGSAGDKLGALGGLASELTGNSALGKQANALGAIANTNFSKLNLNTSAGQGALGSLIASTGAAFGSRDVAFAGSTIAQAANVFSGAANAANFGDRKSVV